MTVVAAIFFFFLGSLQLFLAMEAETADFTKQVVIGCTHLLVGFIAFFSALSSRN